MENKKIKAKFPFSQHDGNVWLHETEEGAMSLGKYINQQLNQLIFDEYTSEIDNDVDGFDLIRLYSQGFDCEDIEATKIVLRELFTNCTIIKEFIYPEKDLMTTAVNEPWVVLQITIKQNETRKSN